MSFRPESRRLQRDIEKLTNKNCLSLACLAGPTSVREQIKLINEKFAGAADTQWQSREPYPSQYCVVLQLNKTV